MKCKQKNQVAEYPEKPVQGSSFRYGSYNENKNKL